MSTWRERMRPIIHKVIVEIAGEGDLVEPGSETEKAIRRALRKRWDDGKMGPRSMHPYKVWLDEIRVQLRRRSPEAALEMFQEMVEEQPDGDV